MDYVDETDYDYDIEQQHYFSVYGEMLKRIFELRDFITTLLQNDT